MKNLKKVIIVLMALSIGLSSILFGCGSENYGDKTVLRIGLYEGGWGAEWLNKVIAKFETDYPEYKVLVDGDKTKYKGANLQAAMETSRQDLYIAPMYLYDYASRDLLLDITDVMTTPLNEMVKTSDTSNIQSKMWTDLDAFYKSYGNQDKYYSIPFGGGIYSLNYDRDLFNQESLFIGKDSTPGNIQWVNEEGPLSVGQDGETGTYDDGLPITYDDFNELLERMRTNNITPFIWSNEIGYLKNLLNSLIASYEGKENFNLFKNGGTYTFAGDSQPTTITSKNAYLLQGMTGKKVSLQFAYDITANDSNFDEQSGTINLGYLDAQIQYLLSLHNAKEQGTNRIAFLVDGAHWYNEAKDTINDMAEISDDYANRRFGIMPFPRFEGQTNTKATYFASSFSQQVCIRKKAEQPELAKLFLAYLHTEESLIACTQYSGMVRPLEYKMPEAILNSMPYYYQSLWYTFSNADIVHNISTNSHIYKNESFFDNEWLFTCHTADGKSLSNPFKDFRDSTKNVTVDDYVNALKYTFNAQYWAQKVLINED